MGQIKLLEEHIADKIAAGEVIERPLSVVKELLENSLDAGADFIEIEIKEGGTSLIRVKDNGKGMDEADMRLAFQRHATSKIREFQDLYKLNTFGFRGEALPSIAAVAQVEMNSCTAEETIGHKLRIDGGNVLDFTETATAPGTVLEVKNLFYNIPARRKFLKSNSYEAGLIGDLISKYAMGHPTVRFRYVSNGQLQLDTAGLNTMEQRMAYVYGSNLESLIVPVEKKEIGSGRWLEARLVREEINRNNRGQEVFFVNGRLVKSTELSQTLEESYYTLIAKGRFPVAVVHLTLPGSELDVNIHPAKTEIKINGFEQLKPKIIELLKDALWEANITKNAFLPETVAPAAFQKQTPSVGQIVQQQQQSTVTAPKQDAKKSVAAQDIPSNQQKQENDTVSKEVKSVSYHQAQVLQTAADIVAEPEKLLQYKTEEIKQKPADMQPTVTQDNLFSTSDNIDNPIDKSEKNMKLIVSDKMVQHEENKSVSKQKTETVQLKGIKDLSVIGQLQNSFILAQNEEGLYIIDQHTCHERILYEKFRKAEAQKEVISQPLLIPVTVTVSAQQDSILMQHIFTLRELGFVLENFGDRCYLLRSLPLGLSDLPNVEEFFLDLLHDLSQQKEITATDIKEKLLITASCKGAVKAHWPLTEIEMRTLLHDLSQVENAHTCPHGRPIVYKITMNELYKIFKRGVSMVNCAITTSKARGKHGLGLTPLALQLSQQLEIPVIDRANKGIPWLLQHHQLDCLLVEEEQALIVHWPDGAQLTFHPGMAVPRIKQIKDGDTEMLCQVMALQSGDHILDCTMGMANDAIVAAFAVGEQGSVTALESSPLIYAATTYGLQNWPTDSWRMKQAMERIITLHVDYHQYLPQQQPESYDVIYFDPMFERPIMGSSGIAPLRREADYAPLTQETLELARTIARRRVVVKHRAGTLRQLQFDEILGGKYSALAYGILYANK